MFTNTQILIFVNAYIEYTTLLGFLIGCYGYKTNRDIQPIIYLQLFTFLNYQVLLYSDFYYISVFHVFNPLQLLLLGWFFYRNFEEGLLKRSVPYILAAAMVFAVVNTAFLQDIEAYPSNFIVGETLLLIVWAILLFIQKLDAPAGVNIFKEPVFIIAAAILCFNIFSFIFFLLISYFEKHSIDQFSSISKILYFANIIYYGLLFIANIFSLKDTTGAKSRW